MLLIETIMTTTWIAEMFPQLCYLQDGDKSNTERVKEILWRVHGGFVRHLKDRQSFKTVKQPAFLLVV